MQKHGADSRVTANDSEPDGYPTAEFEPNTTLDNANSLAIDRAVTSIEGNLGWNEDIADNFVFTPLRTGDYRILLCAATCDGAIEDRVFSLTVLDQSQTTIASTSPGLSGEESLSIRLNAGVAYYAAVNAFGARGSYRLMIFRADGGA